ncbi:IPTL-CTERM sorting domain-containing protein [Rhodoferax sp.]|uniref:IPTL-CTERM sorting domain-containing protein n=1 Tax=Rhodoferax sp. TaxID=50421 RepID=UPI002618DE2D|nr:IPTL-CTERM sorting domain-containing protein [Rhodoferax sp.]MDD2925013.1 IPTL-CTERM sorting domain-containing protein [Rhodoferax sp.]
MSNYATINNHTTSALGSVGNYLNTMKVTGTLTTVGPLAPNLAAANIAPQVTAFSFSDGLTTFASTDANVRMPGNIMVSTNATGQITSASVSVERWQAGAAPHAVNDRLDYLSLSGISTTVAHNFKCLTIGVSWGTADYCTFLGTDTNASTASVSDGGAWSIAAIVSAVATVPTLSEWGVIILVALMAMLGLVHARRTQRL